MELYQVSHDSFGTRGHPWIQRILSGLLQGRECAVCGVQPVEPSGDLRALLESEPARRWPDVLGCGSYPAFIVSRRCLQACQERGIVAILGGRLTIEPPVPAGLPEEDPGYLWIDGKKHRGALLDFEASGFVGVRFCPGCGNRTDDLGATYKKQHEAVFPLRLMEGSWTGLDLFTTDLSHTSFFCTRKLVDLASELGLTNFRFVPAERGAAGKPIRYL